MRKKDFSVNDYCITSAFENGIELKDFFGNTDICYKTFVSKWNKDINVNLGKVRNIYLIDTIIRNKGIKELSA